jgi:transposase
MPKSRPPYPAEYRRRIIELARVGRSVNELAREFEPSANAIRYWLKQAGLNWPATANGINESHKEIHH